MNNCLYDIMDTDNILAISSICIVFFIPTMFFIYYLFNHLYTYLYPSNELNENVSNNYNEIV